MSVHSQPTMYNKSYSHTTIDKVVTTLLIDCHYISNKVNIQSITIGITIILPLGKVPTECFDQLFEDCGGVMNASSCGSLPHNK